MTYSAKFILVVALTMLCSVVSSQVNLNVSEIPDSLKKKATSVVRFCSIDFTRQSATSGITRNVMIITVLSSNGGNDADFREFGDKFRVIKKFSGEIYDAGGRLIRKIKSGDMITVDYSDYSLASDNKIYYYDCSVPIYPFTVKYEWEVQHQNGVIAFPMFVPQNRYNQSLQRAVYSVSLPDGVAFNYKALNMPSAPKKESADKLTKYIWTLDNLTAFSYEPFEPSWQELMPILYCVPDEFEYDGTKGKQSDWSNFGLWQYGLLKGRDVLPENIKQKINEFVADAPNDREKVRRIYDYLAQTTRYVSIQLGIGGLQPMSSLEVGRIGFGDCKALSSYMAAMLKHVGINSVYTVISTDNPRLLDLASANQMNHVILQVPLPRDTLWLECTNAELPFGYVHNSIAGHDALLIKETGGEVCRLPTYTDSLNVDHNQITVTILNEANVLATVRNRSQLSQYETKVGFTKMSVKEQTDYLRKMIDLTQAEVKGISFKVAKESVPSIETEYTIESKHYGTSSGSRMFVVVNPFRKAPRRIYDSRKHNISIDKGFRRLDEIRLMIPADYKIEAKSKGGSMETPFGRFTANIKQTDNEIVITNDLIINKGYYDASKFAEYNKFCAFIESYYNDKIILVKQ